MHMRLCGERPYPGCDVMSREDSDGLQTKKEETQDMNAEHAKHIGETC